MSTRSIIIIFQVSQQYQSTQDRRQLSPHIYATADLAYQTMLREQKPQCCIVSGESGAGKTESTKYMVEHLLTVAVSSESNLNKRIQQVCNQIIILPLESTSLDIV